MTLRLLRLLYSFCLHARAKCLFLSQLLHISSKAGQLCERFQFGALPNLHGFSFVDLFFGLVPGLFVFCVGSFVPFPRFVIRASGMMFFRFFSYLFSLIISMVFFNSNFFTSVCLSRSFVSVIAVMNLEMSKSSALIPSNAHFYSISISLRQKSSGVSVSDCLVQKNFSRLW